MYIPPLLLFFFVVAIAADIFFIVTIVRTRQILLIHKFYFAAAMALIIWLLALIGIGYTDPGNTPLLALLDSTTTIGGALIPPCSLLFAICYTKEYDHHLPKRYWLLFVIPAITILLIYTNEYHHLYYKVFSLLNTSVVFGPYFYVHSVYVFTCVFLSVFIIIRFAIKTKTKLHLIQAILFTIGSLAPSVTNLLILCNVMEANISLTPTSFIITMIFHGIIIYRMHLFDIKPIAMQQVLNVMGDSYLVTNAADLVVSYNRPFMELLGSQYRIRENVSLQECVQNEDVENKTEIYNLLTAVQACKAGNTRITYEQAINRRENEQVTRRFYMIEVMPLVVKNETCGSLSIFRDITQVKINMQRMQDNQVKMMEQERLAFLGQMVGGMAHNLKTPIMSISGSTSAVENLIQECRESIGDPEVTAEDFDEIYTEMNNWLNRMRDACAYMSDIISAVKGQASNMNVTDSVDFSLEETFKRVSLLLRHELLNSKCVLKINFDFSTEDVLIHGDINNLVQVINNLISNAIDAQEENGNHDIIVTCAQTDKDFWIRIKDFGTGIPESIRLKLFQQMVTSKGTLGTGLGIFISNTVIRAKFEGSMCFEDNPEGGTIWGISIPLSKITWIRR